MFLIKEFVYEQQIYACKKRVYFCTENDKLLELANKMPPDIAYCVETGAAPKKLVDIFKNQKFITCGVANTIPKLLQIIMWELINNLPVDSRDYLQVFSLSPDIKGQRIIHNQENPNYKKEYVFNIDTNVIGKVFVIDDGTHSTMLMNYEY